MNSTDPRDYMNIEERHLRALLRWIEHGLQPGHFLSAVLRNDLNSAFAHADYGSADCLWAIVTWLYNRAPSECCGSEENVKKWTPLTKEQADEWRHDALRGTCLELS